MKISFISCVKTKRLNPCIAEHLYISDLFKKSLNYCKNNYDKVYILSAKYGLLNLSDIIEPYEKTLNKMSKKEKNVWYQTVSNSIKQHINKHDILYFHCGINYRDGLIKLLHNKYEIPLKGISFGNQLKFYKNNNTNQLKLKLI